MLSTIKGLYDNGKIIFTEEPPVKTKAEVIITFLTEKEEKSTVSNQQRITLGMLEGKIKLPDDFNEPLEDFCTAQSNKKLSEKFAGALHLSDEEYNRLQNAVAEGRGAL